MLALHSPKSSRKFFLQDSVAVTDAQAFQVASDRIRRRRGVFHEVYFLGSAAQGFDSNRSRSGEQIQPDTALERRRIPGSQHIEQSFPQPVRRGPNVDAAQRMQRPASIFTRNHSHASVLLDAAFTISIHVE